MAARIAGKTATKQTIELTARSLFARVGYEGFSMRLLAQECGVSLSSLYHFFKDKDDILKHIYLMTNRQLGIQRGALDDGKTMSEMLWKRIEFQFEHIEQVVFVLKYYLHFRQSFEKNSEGHLPHKSALHIEEVLHRGIKDGDIVIGEDEILQEAKIVAHAINGFMLEYYPDSPEPEERKHLIDSMHDFILRALYAKGGTKISKHHKSIGTNKLHDT